MRAAAGDDSQLTQPSVAVRTEPSALRQLVDALVCLAAAVGLFRTFEIEGYMISTGSMAPSLLGYHKRVVCPTCSYSFAYGAVDSDAVSEAETRNERRQAAIGEVVASNANGRNGISAVGGASGGGEVAACPNCGQQLVGLRGLPLNQGDQLLVYKNAYSFRPPRRWEVVVFRNPSKPTQAYVKRAVGLPGETVAIREGDVYVGGRIQRKPLSIQRGVRIPVFDNSHKPTGDAEWQSRWISEPGRVQWRVREDGFEAAARAPGDTAWLRYRHWVRSGGVHKTEVPLQRLPDGVHLPGGASTSIRFDVEAGRLWCIGALSATARDRLLALSDEPRFAAAVERLYRDSHVAPVTDVYGYNRSSGGLPPVPVRDLMLSAELTLRGSGRLVVQMTDGGKLFECVIDVGGKKAELREDGSQVPVRTAELPAKIAGRSVLFEMSLFDRQVLVALDGESLFPAWPIGGNAEVHEPARNPVRIGAEDLSVQIASLKLFRDVHYTRKAGARQYRLGSDEYFMLGDNSPVSFDSRSWPPGAVRSRLLLGKAFIVHLPSRPGKLEIGGWNAYIRIPDLSRIRYIR